MLTTVRLATHAFGHMPSRIPGLTLPFTRTRQRLTLTFRYPCADSNTQTATFSPTYHLPCPPLRSHWGSLITGSGQTLANIPAITLFQGKLGVAGRLLNLEGLLLRGKPAEEGKKEPSTDDGKPSSEQGITGGQPGSSCCFH